MESEKVRLAPSVPTKCPDCGASLAVLGYSTLTRYYKVEKSGVAVLTNKVADQRDDTVVLACDVCAYERSLRDKDGVLALRK